jgi:hypothetical protein
MFLVLGLVLVIEFCCKLDGRSCVGLLASRWLESDWAAHLSWLFQTSSTGGIAILDDGVSCGRRHEFWLIGSFHAGLRRLTL